MPVLRQHLSGDIHRRHPLHQARFLLFDGILRTG